jgi:hypothetical protein
MEKGVTSKPLRAYLLSNCVEGSYSQTLGRVVVAQWWYYQTVDRGTSQVLDRRVTLKT